MFVAAYALSAPGCLLVAAENASSSTGALSGPKPAVAERADMLLKQMAADLGSAEQFTFHADITFDHVLPSGQLRDSPHPR